jgi:CBS domain containing-hemolysin-like protein
VLLTLSPAQVEALAASGSRAGRLMCSFKHRIDVPISAILIVNTIAHTIGAAVAGASYQNVFDPATLWIFSLVFTVAVLLFTEIIPKTLGVTHAERLAPPVAHGINGLIFLLRPAVAVTEKLSALLRGRAARPSTSVEEIRLLAQHGRSEGAVGERTAGMIVGATQLRELKADDVMLPRRQVVFLSAQDSTATVVERVRSSRHSRFPFTPTGSLDNFSGVVLAKELLQQLLDGAERINWEALIREPVVVPEAQPLNMLLRTFQEARKHMAMVVDEYGQCQGIVTIEDVLEEIVGDIIDESDVVRDTYAEDQDGRLQFSADLDLRSLAQRLGVAWDPRERAHSVNGLVTERLGRLPRVGDWIEWQGYRVEVTAVGERRADRIAVRKAQAIPPAPSAPDGPA